MAVIESYTIDPKELILNKDVGPGPPNRAASSVRGSSGIGSEGALPEGDGNTGRGKQRAARGRPGHGKSCQRDFKKKDIDQYTKTFFGVIAGSYVATSMGSSMI